MPVSVFCMALWFGCFVFSGACQPVSLSVQMSNGQVRVIWPAGLGLVQPQKRTNLASGTWQDLGAATTATNLTEAADAGQGYYRLQLPARPAGIYAGGFAGQSDNGGFSIMLRSNGLAYVVGYNTPQDEGLFASAFPVAMDGTFATTTAQGGRVGGTFTMIEVSGSFTNRLGETGSYSGNRKGDSGIHATDVGYYAGTYGGLFEGSAFAIVAADGSVFFYTIDNPSAPTSDGDGGGKGTINAANSFAATTVPNGLTVSGTLNPGTHTITGTYSSGGSPLGTFSVTRTLTP